MSDLVKNLGPAPAAGTPEAAQPRLDDRYLQIEYPKVETITIGKPIVPLPKALLRFVYPD